MRSVPALCFVASYCLGGRKGSKYLDCTLVHALSHGGSVAVASRSLRLRLRSVRALCFIVSYCLGGEERFEISRVHVSACVESKFTVPPLGRAAPVARFAQPAVLFVMVVDDVCSARHRGGWQCKHHQIFVVSCRAYVCDTSRVSFVSRSSSGTRLPKCNPFS